MNFMLTILLIVLATAVATDLLYRKIPNALTIPAAACGLMYHIYLNGLDGFLFSIKGLLLGLGLLLVFYAFGIMGAGDVKLMGSVGSILGPAAVFKAFLFTAIVGGIFSIIVLARHGQLVSFSRRIWLSLKLTLMTRGLTLAPGEGKPPLILCYGIAIAVGTSLSILF